MKKLEFINALGGALSQLPPDEVRPLLDYYVEAIDDRVEDGMTEEAAIASLGSIEELSRKILSQRESEPPAAPPFQYEASAPEPPKARRFTGAALALAIVLSPLWLTLFCLVLGLEAAIWSVLGALLISAGAMILAGIAGAVVSLIPTFDPVSLAARIFVCGGCLLTAGIGFLLLPLSLWLLRLFARLHRWCFRKLRGKE